MPGIIIAPSDLTDLLPVAVAKDSELLVTQYEGEIIESAGVIRWTFLGWKTLSIPQDRLKHIKLNHHRDIDLIYWHWKTSQLSGCINGERPMVHFSSRVAGMQKYLKELKPDKFEDLYCHERPVQTGSHGLHSHHIARKQGRERSPMTCPKWRRS